MVWVKVCSDCETLDTRTWYAHPERIYKPTRRLWQCKACAGGRFEMGVHQP
jgi:hypothetical protein